jgi:hypothetical protein
MKQRLIAVFAQLMVGIFVISFTFGTALSADVRKPIGKDKKTAKIFTEPIYQTPKKVILIPGSMQEVKSNRKNLVIEFEKMHKTGKFPIVRIQGIQFKLTKPNNKLEFTWQKAGYELTWLPFSEKVALVSSEPMFKKSFSLQDENVKSKLIRPGLTVESKRRDGVMAKLQVVDVIKDANGQMEKFSVRTFADKSVASQYHTENNIMAPEFHKQYEKGINGEVLFVFTSDEKGKIYVYYR